MGECVRGPFRSSNFIFEKIRIDHLYLYHTATTDGGPRMYLQARQRCIITERFNFSTLTKMSALDRLGDLAHSLSRKPIFTWALGHNLSSTITIQWGRSPANDRKHTVEYL